MKADLATQGSWEGVYGGDGYNVIGASASYPSYAQVSASGYSSYTWTNSTSDPRALQKPGGGAVHGVHNKAKLGFAQALPIDEFFQSIQIGRARFDGMDQVFARRKRRRG